MVVLIKIQKSRSAIAYLIKIIKIGLLIKKTGFDDIAKKFLRLKD